MKLINIRSNEIANRKTIKKIHELKICFSANIKTDRPLPKLTKKRRHISPPSGMKPW